MTKRPPIAPMMTTVKPVYDLTMYDEAAAIITMTPKARH
jgi:hypothetical protein